MLLTFYIALTDFGVLIPYLNLLVQDTESRLILVWLLSLILYKFSVNLTVVWITVFLFLSLLGMHVGFIIYISLLFLFFFIFK